MRAELPPIAKASQQILVSIEQAVIRFARSHKYGVGADLRRESMRVARCVHRAWRERTRQLQRVHELAARRYLRYVDDFVLVHRDPHQLAQWQARIEHFLSEHLRLALKPDAKLLPLDRGIDFLGYVIYPTHTVVRRRVIGHARAKLEAWERRHIRRGRVIAEDADLETLRSVWASYTGHFRHASSYRLIKRCYERFPWLVDAARGDHGEGAGL